MAKTKKKRKLGWLILLLCMILYAGLFLWGTSYGLEYLWGVMEAYEASRSYIALDGYMEKIDADYVCDRVPELIAKVDHNIQSEEACRAVIKDYLSDGITCAKKSSECTEDTLVYVLRTGDTVIGEFTMQMQGQASHGFTPWTVTSDSFNLDFLLTQTVSAQAPSHYPVYVNGVQLDESYIVESGIQYEYLADYYEEYQPPYMVSYTAGPCLGSIELRLTDPAGNPFAMEEVSDPSPLFNNCTEEQITALDTFMNAFIERYVAFTVNVNSARYSNYNKLIPYIVEGSMLALRMEKAIEGLEWVYSMGDEIVSITANQRVYLGDGHYLYDVTYLVDSVTIEGTVRSTNNIRIMIVETDDGLKAESMTSY